MGNTRRGEGVMARTPTMTYTFEEMMVAAAEVLRSSAVT